MPSSSLSISPTVSTATTTAASLSVVRDFNSGHQRCCHPLTGVPYSRPGPRILAWPAECSFVLFRRRLVCSFARSLLLSHLGFAGTLPWEADTERRTVFFKYALYGRPRGDNCAYYDLSDPRLHPEQLAILDGGACRHCRGADWSAASVSHVLWACATVWR